MSMNSPTATGTNAADTFVAVLFKNDYIYKKSGNFFATMLTIAEARDKAGTGVYDPVTREEDAERLKDQLKSYKTPKSVNLGDFTGDTIVILSIDELKYFVFESGALEQMKAEFGKDYPDIDLSDEGKAGATSKMSHKVFIYNPDGPDPDFSIMQKLADWSEKSKTATQLNFNKKMWGLGNAGWVLGLQSEEYKKPMSNCFCENLK